MKAIDLTGRRFERLVVLEPAGHRGKKRLWRCACDCGGEIVTMGENLRENRARRTRSCGCLHRDRITKHGHMGRGAASPTYRSWLSMIQRCTNPKVAGFDGYGGRGIRVCLRWRSFENFLADMGERPDGRSIDRIDNDGDYERGNCRWATRSEQQRNKRRTAKMEAMLARPRDWHGRYLPSAQSPTS